MDPHASRHHRRINLGLAVAIGWCLAVWVGLLHLLGLGL
jgi:hypothetical protein